MTKLPSNLVKGECGPNLLVEKYGYEISNSKGWIQFSKLIIQRTFLQQKLFLMIVLSSARWDHDLQVRVQYNAVTQVNSGCVYMRLRSHLVLV